MVDTSWMKNKSPANPGRTTDDRRCIVDHGWDGNRFPPAEQAITRSPPKSVERALREDCHIEVKDYFLATVLQDGEVNYFTSSSERLAQKDIPNIFSMSHFMRALNYDGTAVDSMDTTGLNDYNQSGGRRLDRMNSFGSRGRVPESRRRPRLHVNRRNRRREPMSPPARKIPLRLSNSDGVWDFYLQRFKAIQQTACKLIAKAWIKAVAPRKQSTHPYTGQEIPAWWPRPWGSTQFEQVRHKEPDHLKKYERIPLCAHILRLVIEPNNSQHPDIRRLNLTVNRLEEVARDALSLFFSENANNEAKRPVLKEIMKVARMEEQYKRGGIDGNTDIFVSPPDSNPTAEEEDDDDDEGSASPRSIHADNSLSIMIHNQSTPGSIPGPSSIMTLPPPTPHYGPGSLTSPMGAEQSPYMDNATPMEIDESLQGHHGSSRRTSMYTSSPSEYGSSLGPQVPVYPSSGAGPAWQQTTSAPPSSSIFTYSNQVALLPPLHPQHHTQAHSSGYVGHMEVQLGQHQYLGSPFDGPTYRNTSGQGAAPGYGQRGYGH